jgi:putative sterol carrier protein
MGAVFPSAEWLKDFEEKLNTDEHYAQVARNWEGDMCFVIEPDGNLTKQVIMYLDLWHGKCRSTALLDGNSQPSSAFTLKAGYGNFAKVISGQMDPMQAMLTRKLDVKGNMAQMMRNVPTVLDFVRCAREVTKEVL